MATLQSQMSPVGLCIEIGSRINDAVNDAKEKGIDPEDKQKVFVTEHAKNIAMLMANISHMQRELHSYCAKLLIRPMLEGMFNMVAAIKHPGFAESKMLSEVENWLVVLKKQQQKKDLSEGMSAALGTTIPSLETEGQKWKATYKLNSRGWKTREICETAGCMNLYFQYQTVCNDSHAAFSSLNPFTKMTRGLLLNQACYVGGNTLFEYRKFLDASKLKEHADEGHEITEVIARMNQDGCFDRLEWD